MIEDELEKQLRSFGGVSIEGPRWCGKTWLGLNASNGSFLVGDIDEYGQDNKDPVDVNIRLTMEGDSPHLIDEWQEVPRLWDAVRSDIDRNPVKRKYILTGSSTPRTVKPVHIGTGRIKHLKMRTMSLFESGFSDGSISLKDIISGTAPGIAKGGTDLEHLIDLRMSGGWPGNLGLPYDDRVNSVKGYLESMMAVASNMDGVRRKESSLWMVIRSLARNECTLASDAKIHNDTGVPLDRDAPIMLKERIDVPNKPLSYDTVTDYIDVFHRLFLIDDQPAFDPNLRSSTRVGKTGRDI